MRVAFGRSFEYTSFSFLGQKPNKLLGRLS